MPIPEIPDLSGLHPFIDQQLVEDMWDNFHDPGSGWSTTINIDYEQSPLHHAKKVFKWSEAQVNEVWKILEWGTPYPDPNPPSPSKLSVSGGKLCYGSITKFAGVSRREILKRAKGQSGGLSPDYTLEDYERDIIDSGINYVRHIGVMDTVFLKAHCERMKAHDIIVEVEVYESETNEVRVDLNAMGQLAGKNVFFDVGNELTNRDAVDDVINICKQLKSQGCIVSAGAWGSSHHGEEYSKEFHERYNGNHINTHHRHWTASSFQETIALGKPVCFNEFFAMKSQMSLSDVKLLMKTAFDMGLNVCYYGFRDESLHLPGLTIYDPFNYMDILYYAGSLINK